MLQHNKQDFEIVMLKHNLRLHTIGFQQAA
jgi:hypothetical protein